MTYPAPLTISGPQEHLCTSCGMCCDGTLFTYVEVGDDERAAVEQLFTLVEGEEGPIFHQPCVFNRDCKCLVYHDRPQTCRIYRCKTLSALEAGEINAAEASRRVAEAQHARAEILPLLEVDETISKARVRRAATAADPERTRTQMAFILKLTALDLMLDRYFRKRGKTMLS